MNIIDGMIRPETNCAPKLALNSVLVLLPELLVHLALAAEHVDQLVAGERLLDVRVELAGVRPLRHELLLRPLGDPGGHEHRQRDA